MVQSFKNLIVWQKSMSLVKAAYFICKQLPKSEQFVLISQMQRSAISIPSNIAEGFARKGTKELIQFLSTALGSATELETQLLIARQQYSALNVDEALGLCEEVQRMLFAMIKKLKLKTSG